MDERTDEESFDESLHALPGWFAWFQKTFGLTFLVVAEAYLLGNLATLGWVPDITFGTILGSFRGVGVLLFFLAGVAVAGIGLTCSVVFVGSVKRRQWFMAFVTGVGCLIFFGVEVWASLSERSVNLHATPADLAVLAAFGFKGIPPISPTVVVVSILFPLGSLYFGFVQQRRAAVTAQDIAEDEMEMQRKIRLAELQAQLNEANAQKNAAAAKGMVGVVRAGMQAARGTPGTPGSRDDEVASSGASPTADRGDGEDELEEPDEDAEILASEGNEPGESILDSRRRRWEQMDALRARMG